MCKTKKKKKNKNNDLSKEDTFKKPKYKNWIHSNNHHIIEKFIEATSKKKSKKDNFQNLQKRNDILVMPQIRNKFCPKL